jgi:WD40 repeat protein
MKISAKRIQALTGHQAAVYAVSQGTQPATIITAGSDRNIVEWDLHGINPPRIIAHSAGVVYSLLVLPNEPILLIGNNQGGIHVVDLAKKAEVKYLLAHTIGVFDLLFIPSKNEVIASGADGNLTVWSTSDFHCKGELKISNLKVRKLALSPDESKLALACSDKIIRILDTSNYQTISRDRRPQRRSQYAEVFTRQPLSLEWIQRCTLASSISHRFRIACTTSQRTTTRSTTLIIIEMDLYSPLPAAIKQSRFGMRTVSRSCTASMPQKMKATRTPSTQFTGTKKPISSPR